MCYSGYRIKAYENMEINIDEKYFKGGVKTKTSKNRIVPIHSAILPLVIRRLQRDREMLHSAARYRLELHEKLEQLNLRSTRRTIADIRSLCYVKRLGCRKMTAKECLGTALEMM